MRRWIRLPIVVPAVLLALATTGLPVHASDRQFSRSVLNGAQAQPASPSPGTGNVQVIVDPDDHQMTVQGTFRGLRGKTTASHIHGPARPGEQAGGMVTANPSFSSFPMGVKSGSFAHTIDLTKSSSFDPAFLAANGGTPASAEQALIAMLQAGTAIFDIHTTSVPGGEIGGVLQRFDPTPVATATWSRVKSLYR